MSESLSFTGERFLPEREGEIWYEHWHRYALARRLSQHCTVLDVACGEGYGAAMMAESADRVIGVDVSIDAIRHATRRYGQRTGLDFIPASCDRLPFPDASFDLAISFETIEHIETQQAFIAELARVLRPDGVLLISSPNKRLYSDAHDYHNEFHVRELYREELEELLREAFPYRSWLGQKLLFHSAIWPEMPASVATEYLAAEDGRIVEGGAPSVEPMYYIVACSRNSSMLLPALLNRPSLFSDLSETVYQDYARQTRRVIELDRLLIDRERIIAERDEFLALRTRQMEERESLIVERERIIVERDELLALRNEQIEKSELLFVECNKMLAERAAQLQMADERLLEQKDMLQQQEEILQQMEMKLAQSAGRLGACEQELMKRESWRWWLKQPFRKIAGFIK